MGSATFLRLGAVLTLADFSAVLIFVGRDAPIGRAHGREEGNCSHSQDVLKLDLLQSGQWPTCPCSPGLCLPL